MPYDRVKTSMASFSDIAKACSDEYTDMDSSAIMLSLCAGTTAGRAHPRGQGF